MISGIAIIAVFMLIVSLLGPPSEFTFGIPPLFGSTWKIPEEPIPEAVPEPQPQPTPQATKTPEIKINSFKTKQKIYQPGDTVYVDFKITNELNIPYNITVDWLFNNSRYTGWHNKSTDVYDTSIQDNIWDSYITINKAGDWEAHLVINYTLQNKTFSNDAVTKFKVV